MPTSDPTPPPVASVTIDALVARIRGVSLGDSWDATDELAALAAHAIADRDAWAHQCNLASEAQADAVARLSTAAAQARAEALSEVLALVCASERASYTAAGVVSRIRALAAKGAK